MIRQAWPKPAPRKRRHPVGFSDEVKAAVVWRSGGVCELDSCGRAVQIHHRAPRGRGGARLDWVNAAANALHVSLACHARIESDRSVALENGWLILRNGWRMASEVPVLRRGRLVLLDDDGHVCDLPYPVGGAG